MSNAALTWVREDDECEVLQRAGLPRLAVGTALIHSGWWIFGRDDYYGHMYMSGPHASAEIAKRRAEEMERDRE